MRLPNAEQAIVAREKITDYLLSETSERGRHKSRFFRSFGFHPDRWQEFAEVLQVQGSAYEVAQVMDTIHGRSYTVVGEIETPDQRNPRIRTVWLIEPGSNVPRFITAYPRAGR